MISFIIFCLTIIILITIDHTSSGTADDNNVSSSTYSGFYKPSTSFNYEPYAGAWLITRNRFISISHNIHTISNLEGATLSALSHIDENLMTRDYLDYFVVHLSSTINEAEPILYDPQIRQELLHRMHQTVSALRRNISSLHGYKNKPIKDGTVVLVPFSTIAASINVDHESLIPNFPL